VSIIPRFVLGSLDLTEPPFMVGFGSDVGRPENVAEVIDSMLQDGELVSSTRSSNRTMTLNVYIDESDMLTLAQAEAALIAECDKQRNTFAIDPGDGFGPVTVFDTYRVQPTFVRDDETEAEGLRHYTLSIPAAPFGRSVEEVVTAAVGSGEAPPPPTTAVIDAASSTTNWHADGGTLSGSGGTVAVGPNSWPKIYYQGTVDMTSTPYLIVDWKVETSVGPKYVRSFSMQYIDAAGASRSLTPIAKGVAAIAGYTRSYYWLPPGVVTKFFFDATAIRPNAGAPDTWATDVTVRIDSLTRTDQPPWVGTARQGARTLQVEGSARTQGALAIEHETSALGRVLAYTWPDDGSGYLPPLVSRWVSGTAATIDTSLVSGGYRNIDTAQTFDIPAAQVPEGSYLLLARVRSDTASTQSITYTAQGRMGSTAIGPLVSGAGPVVFGSTGAWQIVVLGRVTLPTVDMSAATSGTVRVTLAATDAAASNIDLDEAWLFNTTVGALTVVDCKTGTPGAGGPSNRLWIETATVDRPLPTLLRGYAADQSDAFYVGADAAAWGMHDFTPPTMNVFTVTTNALDAAVTLRHYPRWWTHAAS
jgi:hypothetical protein